MTSSTQLTDALTQAAAETLGNTLAVSMANVIIATSHALANAAHNATVTQQNSNITAQAATAKSLETIYSSHGAITNQAIGVLLSNQVRGLY